MSLSFAERMALKKKGLDPDTGLPPTPKEEAPKVENKPDLEAIRNELMGKPAEPIKDPTIPEGMNAFQLAKWKREQEQNRTAVPVTAQAPQEEAPKVPELPKIEPPISVIVLANEANKQSEGEELGGKDIPLEAQRIKQMISTLATIPDGNLHGEMDKLKTLIKTIPHSAVYLLPEEIGECVKALRRMTNNKAVQDMQSARPARGKAAQGDKFDKDLSAADLANALDDL